MLSEGSYKYPFCRELFQHRSRRKKPETCPRAECWSQCHSIVLLNDLQKPRIRRLGQRVPVVFLGQFEAAISLFSIQRRENAAVAMLRAVSRGRSRAIKNTIAPIDGETLNAIRWRRLLSFVWRWARIIGSTLSAVVVSYWTFTSIV